MALTTVTVTMELAGTVQWGKAGTLTTATDAISFGSGSWDAMTLSLTFGDATNKIEQIYQTEASILTTANSDLDLAGSLTNSFGETITFTYVKFLLVAIDTPDGTKQLRVGPQNVTNGWQGPWGGVGATVYTDVYNWSVLVNNPWTGHAVTAGTADILRLNNPTGVTVTHRTLIFGVQ